MKETVSFTKAILNYFGKKPGQGMKELADEIKALSPEDKAFFIPELDREHQLHRGARGSCPCPRSHRTHSTP